MPICHFLPQVRADGAAGLLDMPDWNIRAPAVGCAHPEFAVQNGSAGLGAGGSSFRPIIGPFAGSRFEFLEMPGFDVFPAPHAALGSGTRLANFRGQARRTLAEWMKSGIHLPGTNGRFTILPCLSAHLVLCPCQGRAIRSQH